MHVRLPEAVRSDRELPADCLLRDDGGGQPDPGRSSGAAAVPADRHLGKRAAPPGWCPCHRPGGGPASSTGTPAAGRRPDAGRHVDGAGQGGQFGHRDQARRRAVDPLDTVRAHSARPDPAFRIQAPNAPGAPAESVPRQGLHFDRTFDVGEGLRESCSAITAALSSRCSVPSACWKSQPPQPPGWKCGHGASTRRGSARSTSITSPRQNEPFFASVDPTTARSPGSPSRGRRSPGRRSARRSGHRARRVRCRPGRRRLVRGRPRR